ncbi:MAG: hypothetical protein AAF447_16295 [Myxococcota bacterium]
MKARVALALTGLLALAAHRSPGSAERPDEEPALPTAAVLVAATPVSDVFLRAYAFEVTATALKELGFHVAPLQLTASRLSAAGRSPGACQEDAECLREVAAELGAPTLVLVRATKSGEAWQLGLRTSRVEVDVVTSAPTEIEGTVSDIFAGVAPVLAEELPGDLPCVVQIEGPAELQLRVDGDERRVSAGRAFIGPGAHRVELRAPGRAPWRGRLRCEGGRTFRMEAQ